MLNLGFAALAVKKGALWRVTVTWCVLRSGLYGKWRSFVMWWRRVIGGPVTEIPRGRISIHMFRSGLILLRIGCSSIAGILPLSFNTGGQNSLVPRQTEPKTARWVIVLLCFDGRGRRIYGPRARRTRVTFPQIAVRGTSTFVLQQRVLWYLAVVV
jgi:hypothetical protein